MRRSFVYHLSLAARSIRRNAGLSFAMFLSLALATSMWATTVEHYLRIHGPMAPLAPSLHQVELAHSETLTRALGHTNAQPSGHPTRTRVSFPEYQALAATGIPTRQTAAIRSRLLVACAGAADGVTARRVQSRFVDADFFGMFAIPLGAGRFFTAAEAAASEPQVVLGERLARALGDACGGVGQQLFVEGKPFRVSGVVAGDQRYRPEWDLATIGGPQDALYLPFAWFRRLLARPEAVIFQSPVGPSFDDLLHSDAVFVSLWTDLPTDERRAAYARVLQQTFGGRGQPYTLRSYAAWLTTFAMPDSSVRFFFLLSGIVLAGAGFNMARLLLAKGLARRDELGIHRALGASRLSLFVRWLLETALLALPAALAGALGAVPFHALFNVLVADTDIPVHVTAPGFGLTVAAALGTALAAALYPAWRIPRTPPTIYMGRS